MVRTHLKMVSIVNNEFTECCLAQLGMNKWQDLQMRECVMRLKIDEGWRKLAAHRKRPSPPLNQKPYARRQTNRSIVRLLWSKQNFAWQWVGQHTHTQSTTTLTAALGKKKKEQKRLINWDQQWLRHALQDSSYHAGYIIMHTGMLIFKEVTSYIFITEFSPWNPIVMCISCLKHFRFK